MVSAKESTEVFGVVRAKSARHPGVCSMYLESVFCFPRIVGNMLGIRGRMNLLLWL